MKYTRVHRLLRIIALVQSRRGLTVAELAETCETTERTIFRDLDQIREAGIPIQHDRASGGYRIDGAFFMPPVRLTFEEALAISALCETMADSGAIPFVRPAAMALHKIQAQLPLDVREELTDRLRTMQLRTTATMDEEGYQDVFDTAQHALAEGRLLRCKYEPASGGDDEAFHFQPYALFFGTRAWYIVGFHEGRDDLRTLKLSRFTAIEATNETCEPPASFSLDAHLGNAWNMIPGDRDWEVAIRFDPPFSSTISDTRWHATQEIEWHDDDACTFRCIVSGLDEIVWWVLSMGPNCQVLEPPELASRVAQLAADTADRYAKAATSAGG